MIKYLLCGILWYCIICLVFNYFLVSKLIFDLEKWMAKCVCFKQVHLSSCINHCFQKILLFLSVLLDDSQLTLIVEFLRAKYVHLSSEVALNTVYCWESFKYCVKRKDWNFIVTVVKDRCCIFMILLCRVLLCLAELNMSTFVLCTVSVFDLFLTHKNN
jgi:hypothetical protein